MSNDQKTNEPDYSVQAMRAFFVNERQKAAADRDAKKYGWMDRNVMTLDTLASDYWVLSGMPSASGIRK